MKIDPIRTFLEISDGGNFNRTAENLHVTQSTVSARVKVMEDRFGRHLLGAANYRLLRNRSFEMWQQVTCAC